MVVFLKRTDNVTLRSAISRNGMAVTELYSGINLHLHVHMSCTKIPDSERNVVSLFLRIDIF